MQDGWRRRLAGCSEDILSEDVGGMPTQQPPGRRRYKRPRTGRHKMP